MIVELKKYSIVIPAKAVMTGFDIFNKPQLKPLEYQLY